MRQIGLRVNILTQSARHSILIATILLSWEHISHVAYSVQVNTVQQMQQEIIDGLNDGFIMQVGKMEK